MSIDKSKRLDPIRRGMKEGAVKKGIDLAVSPITKPVIDAINSKLQEANPNMDLAAPLVEGAIKCSVILGIAELIDLILPFVEERTSFDSKKVDLASELMRKYAGEKMGAEIVDLAFQLLPLAMSAFKELSIKDMQSLIEDIEHVDVSKQESVLEEIKIPTLLEEEEELEVQEPVPIQKKRGRKKQIYATLKV